MESDSADAGEVKELFAFDVQMNKFTVGVVYLIPFPSVCARDMKEKKFPTAVILGYLIE